jgi:hypothetical protein
MMHRSARLLSFIVSLVAARSMAIGWQDTLERTPSPVPASDTVSAEIRNARADFSQLLSSTFLRS